MPHLLQPGAGEHSTHRSAAGLRDQTNNQSDEGLEGGGSEAWAELGQQTGQRARGDGAGRHRRTTSMRTVKERSMLSSSPSKIHEPRVTGVSPRPTTSDSARKLRNTRAPVTGTFPTDEKLRLPGIGIQAVKLSPYRSGPAAPRPSHLDTAAASLACYFPRE